MTERPCSVYVIECAGYAKIGVASDPLKRLAGVNTGSPVRATLVGSREFDNRLVAYEIEGRLHRRLRALRTNGEWFDVDPSLALNMLKAERSLRLRDAKARYDSVDRWDIPSEDETIANLLFK